MCCSRGASRLLLVARFQNNDQILPYSRVPADDVTSPRPDETLPRPNRPNDFSLQKAHYKPT
jgi:hypothetical protein